MRILSEDEPSPFSPGIAIFDMICWRHAGTTHVWGFRCPSDGAAALSP